MWIEIESLNTTPQSQLSDTRQKKQTKTVRQAATENINLIKNRIFKKQK
jgi:hypothetical protein